MDITKEFKEKYKISKQAQTYLNNLNWENKESCIILSENMHKLTGHEDLLKNKYINIRTVGLVSPSEYKITNYVGLFEKTKIHNTKAEFTISGLWFRHDGNIGMCNKTIFNPFWDNVVKVEIIERVEALKLINEKLIEYLNI